MAPSTCVDSQGDAKETSVLGAILTIRNNMYLYPCDTEGKCRQIMFQQNGWAWYESYPKYGMITVRVDSKFGFEKIVGRYKCCTMCHLPLNRTESIHANKLYGYTVEDEADDTDFLELLNEL